MSRSYCVKVIVVSDTIYEGRKEDTSGELAIKILRENGFCVSEKTVVRNSYRDILKSIRDSGERVVILLGGTGPSPRDISIDVVENIAWRCLPGFGELFRHMSYHKIGIYSILTRTGLCVLYDGRVVGVLPGSPDAVSLGIDLLVRVLDHLVEEVDRYESPHK